MKMNQKQLRAFETIIEDLERFIDLDSHEVLDYDIYEACDSLLDLLEDTRRQVENLKAHANKLKD